MPIYPPTLSDHIGPISVSLGDSTKLVQPLSGKDRKMLIRAASRKAIFANPGLWTTSYDFVCLLLTA